MKNKKSIFILLTILLVFCVLFSYYGVGICSKGFNEFDIEIFTLIGDAILVGVATYISTKKITMEMAKKEFNRNNQINITINQIKNQIINYEQFKNLYVSESFIINMNLAEKAIMDKIYTQYIQWEYLFENAGSHRENHLLLNYPFQYYLLFKNNEEFQKKWEELRNFSKSKMSQFLYDMLDNEKIKEFERFSSIIAKSKFYEILNLNPNNSVSLIITVNGIVTSKVFLLPSTRKILMLYFEKECNVEVIAFRHNFDGKEEAVNISGFKYSNFENYSPARINITDYIEVVDN